MPLKLWSPMPAIEGATAWLNGEMKKEDLPTFVHFWSVSCELCKKAMPHVNDLRERYRGKLNVLAVHMPRTEIDKDLEEIKKVAAKHGITHPIFVDNERQLIALFKNKYVPAYYVFDRDGFLRHYQAGNSGMTFLLKRVSRVIGK